MAPVLPGTVRVNLRSSCMLIHELDDASQGEVDLGACEQWVANLKRRLVD